MDEKLNAERLMALDAAATPGPWQGYSEPEVGLPYSLFSGIPMQSGFGPLEPLTGYDIDLVTLLRNAVPSILAMAEENARLREALEQIISLLRATDALQANGFAADAVNLARHALAPTQAEASTLPGEGVAIIRDLLAVIDGSHGHRHVAAAERAREYLRSPPTTPAVESGAVRRFNNPEVAALAVVLFEAFKRAEPNHAITLHPASFMATFADMAHAVLSRPAVESGLTTDLGQFREIFEEWAGRDVNDQPINPRTGVRPLGTGDLRHLVETLDAAQKALRPAVESESGERGVGELWRHVKRGTVYEKIGVAELQCATGQNPGEGEGLVIYRGEDGKLWARMADEFHDGRFTAIDGETT